MNAAEELFEKLQQGNVIGLQGKSDACFGDFPIDFEKNRDYIVGNILEEWLGKWMDSRGIPNIHNERQESPDFWLNPDDLESDWLEVKSFTKSPNFDVAAFRSFLNLVIEKPWKLHSKILLIEYSMEKGVVTIEKMWLKNLWEICSSSERWPVKVQCKSGVINNIRPALWYAQNTKFPAFKCLEHFISALDETTYAYHDTRATIAERWLSNLIDSYKRHYGKELVIPRWTDIKGEYII